MSVSASFCITKVVFYKWFFSYETNGSLKKQAWEWVDKEGFSNQILFFYISCNREIKQKLQFSCLFFKNAI